VREGEREGGWERARRRREKGGGGDVQGEGKKSKHDMIAQWHDIMTS
jgi:hypothetical protein